MSDDDATAAEFLKMLERSGLDVDALAAVLEAAKAAGRTAEYSAELQQKFNALLRQARARRGRHE